MKNLCFNEISGDTGQHTIDNILQGSNFETRFEEFAGNGGLLLILDDFVYWVIIYNSCSSYEYFGHIYFSEFVTARQVQLGHSIKLSIPSSLGKKSR